MLTRRTLLCGAVTALLWPRRLWAQPSSPSNLQVNRTMAIAEVSGQRATGTASAVGSTTIAFPANVAAGDLLVVLGAVWASGGNTSIAVTDTRSTTYTVRKYQNSADTNYDTFIAFGIAPSAGACTVTIDPDNGSNYISASIDEFSGVADPPEDVNGGSTEGNSTTPADSLTTLTADALLLGVMGHASFLNPSLTPGAGYTQIGEYEDNQTIVAHNAVFRLVTTAQAHTIDWTVADAVLWEASSEAFKPAAAEAGGFRSRIAGGFVVA